MSGRRHGARRDGAAPAGGGGFRTATYAGVPFGDEVRPAVPQRLPGRLTFAFYDRGGEGVAYHDAAARNQGSGMLNPPDGSYLHGFRADEAVGTSYTKPGIDDTEFGPVRPDLGMLYVGWTAPGNWLRYTVDVTEPGPFVARLLYTSREGGTVALTVDDAPITDIIDVPTTFDPADPVDWRQWHHWAVLDGIAVPPMGRGRHVLTWHTVSAGQLNYATLDVARA